MMDSVRLVRQDKLTFDALRLNHIIFDNNREVDIKI